MCSQFHRFTAAIDKETFVGWIALRRVGAFPCPLTAPAARERYAAGLSRFGGADITAKNKENEQVTGTDELCYPLTRGCDAANGGKCACCLNDNSCESVNPWVLEFGRQTCAPLPTP